MVGEARSVTYKKGASSPQGDSGSIDDFKFEYEQLMKEVKFDFAFLNLEDCKEVVNGGKEVFIAGGTRNYGNVSSISGEWFTLTICSRQEISREAPIESPRNLGLAPDVKFMDSCPPKWNIEPLAYGNGTNDPQIRFSPKS